MKKIKRFFGIILSALLLSSCAPNEASSGYRRISMDDAVSMMKNEKNYIILDVRTAEEFAALFDAAEVHNLSRSELELTKDLEKGLYRLAFP